MNAPGTNPNMPRTGGGQIPPSRSIQSLLRMFDQAMQEQGVSDATRRKVINRVMHGDANTGFDDPNGYNNLVIPR